MHLVEAIEELALDALAARLVVLRLKLLAHGSRQRRQILDAKADGELVVDGNLVAPDEISPSRR